MKKLKSTYFSAILSDEFLMSVRKLNDYYWKMGCCLGRSLSVGAFCLLHLVGCGPQPKNTFVDHAKSPFLTGENVEKTWPMQRSPQMLWGTFHDSHKGTQTTPMVRRIEIPHAPGACAIWGATGRTDDGLMIFGVSTRWLPEAPRPSARVFTFDPAKNELRFIGDIVSNLISKTMARQASLRLSEQGRIVTEKEPGKQTACSEQQMKVHSKFVTMNDGWTYFASMDEWGEHEDGSILPYWGSHLWRFQANNPEDWERVKAVPEGLIAVSGVGRYLFALGYFGHVVYRFDTVTSEWKRKDVGAVGGHISRNLISDDRGHVWVPRVQGPTASNPLVKSSVELVELNADLNELRSTTLSRYPVTADANSHGITGFAVLANRDIVMLTSSGFLYLIDRPAEEAHDATPATVQEIGWFHGSGEAYAASLYSMDGKSTLAGAVVDRSESKINWVTYDLELKTSHSQSLVIDKIPDHGMRRINIYGSNTRDDEGRIYLAGAYHSSDDSKQFPLCLELSFPPRTSSFRDSRTRSQAEVPRPLPGNDEMCNNKLSRHE